MAYEIYQGHFNDICLFLKDGESSAAISGSTKMSLRIGKTLLESTNGVADTIKWAGGTYSTGEIHIEPGTATAIPLGVYRCPLTIYDSTYTDGFVWDRIQIHVKPDPETT